MTHGPGLVGAVVEGFLFGLLGIQGSRSLVGSIIIATLGAIFVLLIYHKLVRARMTGYEAQEFRLQLQRGLPVEANGWVWGSIASPTQIAVQRGQALPPPCARRFVSSEERQLLTSSNSFERT